MALKMYWNSDNLGGGPITAKSLTVDSDDGQMNIDIESM